MILLCSFFFPLFFTTKLYIYLKSALIDVTNLHQSLANSLSKSYHSSASSSLSTLFYSGKSSGDNLPKPRSEDREPNAMSIRFKELKNATRNFWHDNSLGEGGFYPVFKGWINECTLTAAKPGSGMAGPGAIKKWNHNGIQVSKQWLVGSFIKF